MPGQQFSPRKQREMKQIAKSAEDFKKVDQEARAARKPLIFNHEAAIRFEEATSQNWKANLEVNRSMERTSEVEQHRTRRDRSKERK